MPIILLIKVLFFSFTAFAWQDHHLINGCKVYSMGGRNLRTFPGTMCLFSDDGRLITASDSHIRLITPDNEIKWEHKGFFHHQMNFSEDKKRILTFNSKIVETPSGPRLADTVLIIDVESGRKLFEESAENLFKKAGIESLEHFLSPENKLRHSVEKEISHFNSIYEIPRITNPNVPSYLKEGNLIINGVTSGILIVSPDLSKVLHKGTFPQSHYHRVHDVQVKANGNYLFFNNVVALPGQPDTGRLLQTGDLQKYASSIVEANAKTLKTVFEFRANPSSMFFSIICGSVQDYGDALIFSHFLMGTYIYSKKKKEIVATVPGTHTDEMRVIPSQQTKAQDLSKFLKFWN